MAASPAPPADDAATGPSWASLPGESPRTHAEAGCCRQLQDARAPTALACTAGIHSVPATWANGCPFNQVASRLRSPPRPAKQKSQLFHKSSVSQPIARDRGWDSACSCRIKSAIHQNKSKIIKSLQGIELAPLVSTDFVFSLHFHHGIHQLTTISLQKYITMHITTHICPRKPTLSAL
jgi:hypothetical protein